MGSVYNGDLITSRQDDLDYLLQCENYKHYIEEHKANVLKAGSYLIDRIKKLELFKDSTDELCAALEAELKNHDNSKYSDEEFEPYRRHFNPTAKEKMEEDDIKELADESFEKAWEHHYRNNDHHPYYWRYVTRDDSGNLVELESPTTVGCPMSILAILHMISDWSGMSLKFRNTYSPVSWYNSPASKNEREALNAKTKVLVKNILEKVYGE